VDAAGPLPAGAPATGAGRRAPPGAGAADAGDGVRGPRPARPADRRVELDLSRAAAVSDQGRVHRRNEDAFHVELGPAGAGVAVVCDGISSAAAGHLAAQAAARAAGAVLAGAAGDRSRDAREATTAAVRAAREAVERVPWSPDEDPAMPSCTLVSAVWRDGELVVGWVGDSRAYWVGPGECRQLTVDDSWAVEQVDGGVFTAAEAAADPRFHAITHWVGADAPDRPPRILAVRPDGPGRLVLCTDGLWNYAPTPAALAGLLDALPAGAGPAAVARSLTETALARGGRDNITVAVVDIDPRPNEDDRR
jgi:serine/threonine protein phosphatase PrpC